MTTARDIVRKCMREWVETTGINYLKQRQQLSFRMQLLACRMILEGCYYG